MSLLDSVLGSLFGGSSSPLQSILASLLSNSGGPGGLLEKLREAGYGAQVDSWVGNGANEPIHPGELRDAVGQQQVDRWSAQTGIGQDEILHQLSQIIPSAVDRMTPNVVSPEDPGANPFDGPGR